MMPTRKRPARAVNGASAYSKISATLETTVLNEIRERSANVSEFLNDAAKRKLYRERIRESIEQLEREGVRSDPERQERIRRALLGRAGPARKRR